MESLGRLMESLSPLGWGAATAAGPLPDRFAGLRPLFGRQNLGDAGLQLDASRQLLSRGGRN